MDNNAYCTSKRIEVQIPKAHLTGLVGSRVPVITVLDRAIIGGFPCGLLADSLAPNLVKSLPAENKQRVIGHRTHTDTLPWPSCTHMVSFTYTHINKLEKKTRA